MTVLRTSQKLKQQPSASRVRRGPHSVLSALWKIVTGSLLIDPLVWPLSHPLLNQTIAERGALLCALFTIPFLNQAWVCSRVAALRKGNREVVDGSTKRSRTLFVAVLTAGLLLKPILVGRSDNVLALVLMIFLVLGALKSIKHALEKEKATRELFKDSPTTHIAQWQAQLVTIVGLPFMFARGVSFLTTWGCESASSAPLAFVGFLSSCALLAMLRPDRRFFIGFCVRCKHPVPIVFVDYGSCPLCDDRLSQSA